METITDFDIESLPVKIEYSGECLSPWDDNSKTRRAVDSWRVTIGAEWGNKAWWWSTMYYTGTGLRKNNRLKKPMIADVLYNLFSDAKAADLNFCDWCSEFGYSDDSIKALNTYKQCLEIATALRKHFSPDQRRQIEEIILEM